jgi:AcrR family transcriptional regulator
MSKSKDTKSAILKQALDLSSEVGLEGVTIGGLAKKVGMSKSGLYAHFESKEDLQNQVLDYAADHFAGVVLTKAFKKPRGLPRIRTLFELQLKWINCEFSGGCPFMAAATEFDDKGGPVRDRLVAHQKKLLDAISKSAQLAIEEGHFRDDLDVDQFAFEYWAILLSYHLFARLMRRKDARDRASVAFENLVYRAGET